MPTITEKCSQEQMSSSKEAEIYRRDCGAIYYQCYHCGLQLSDIADTLDHIDEHMISQCNTEVAGMDVVDIKFELLDNVPRTVVDPNQLEQIFVDCSKSISLSEEPSWRIDTATYTVIPVQHTAVMSKENYSDMEGHFEWKCLYCSSLWKKFTKLKQHLQTHSKDRLPNVMHDSNEYSSTTMVQYSFKCTLCPSEFFDSSSSRQHVKDCHGVEPTKCVPCDGEFVSTVHEMVADANKKNQQQDETNEKRLMPQANTFLCILCNKTFSGTLNLMQHTFVHFNLKNFSCSQCPAKFIQMSSIKSHMMKQHASDMDEHLFNIQCRFCDDKVENLLEFVTHTFTHHLDEGDKNNSDLDLMFEYDCRFCSKHFNKWNHASQHLAAHAKDELPTNALSTARCLSERAKSGLYRSEFLYDCIECTRTLCGSFEARNHWITEHPNQNVQTQISSKRTEKDCLKCLDCDGVFSTQLKLMKHRLTHFNVQPYKCKICPTRFSVSRNATLHMIKIHHMKEDDDLSQLDCHYCNAEFTEEVNFITHVYNEHLYVNFNIDEDLDGRCNYECLYCKQIVPQRIQITDHLRNMHQSETIPTTTNIITAESSINELTHKVEFLYCCVHCPKKFRLPHPASEHVKYKHKIEKECLKCHDCDDVFCTQLNLMKHRLMHFRVQPYRCSICSKLFTVSRNATIHMIKIHKMKPEDNFPHQLDCHYCKAEFTEEINFITHMYKEHLYVNFNIDEDLDGRCNYECLYCQEIVSERSQLSEHLQIHQNETIPEPEANNTVESTINELRHKVKFLYCCVHCKKKFRLPHPASEHVKYKHKTETKSIRKEDKKPKIRETHCVLCNITFLTWRSLLNHRAKRHPETHNKDRYKNRPLFYCSTCGKAYRDRGNLNQHEETHARLQSYTCDICNKTYRTKNYIMVHLMKHRNEKNFVCEQCGRAFYSVSKLNSHYQIHQNLKLECDMCDKVFYTRYNLSKHKKTHTSDTRKKCQLCDNYFKSNNSYRTHMLLHTGVKKYACRYCDMTFAQSSGRRGHEKMKHQIV